LEAAGQGGAITPEVRYFRKEISILVRRKDFTQ
jgi:hypothetical protein